MNWFGKSVQKAKTCWRLVKGVWMEQDFLLQENNKQALIIHELTETLKDVGEPLVCGCRPCMGACQTKETLQDELEERAAEARAVLKRFNLV